MLPATPALSIGSGGKGTDLADYKLRKRLRQVGHLCAHPLRHWRCTRAINRGDLPWLSRVPFKYLSNYLALSLSADQRSYALDSHYRILRSLTPRFDHRKPLLIWSQDTTPDSPPLTLWLAPPGTSPMEGELQLSFAFRSELFILTFLFAPGSVFGSRARTVLFIGGVQGRPGTRQEIREAAKLNGEISPASMLMIAARALAAVADVQELVAVAEDNQVSLDYAFDDVKLEYRTFWMEAGGTRRGSFYHLPVRPQHKPLTEVSRTHRSRARRRREHKAAVSNEIEGLLANYFKPAPPVEAPKHSRPRKGAIVRAERGKLL